MGERYLSCMNKIMVFEDIKNLRIVTSTINEVIDLIQDFIDIPPTNHYTDKEMYKLLDDAFEKIVEFENGTQEIFFDTNVIGIQSFEYNLRREIIKIIKDKLIEQRKMIKK